MSHPLENNPEQINCFLDTLEQLSDTRDNRGKRHSQAFIIAATVFAILVGRPKTSSIYRYIKNNIDWLRKITGMKDAKPISRAHLPRLLDRVNWLELDQLVMSHFNLHLFPEGVDQEWVAIDGKLMKGTTKTGEKQALIHAVTHDSRTELAQARQSGSKSSEIPVVRKLLKESGLEKRKVTLDAHHCNPETTARINSADGEYITQVKENQPTLLRQCQCLDSGEEELFSYESHEKEHGRLTSRYTRIHPMNTLPLDGRWKDSGLHTMIAVTRHTLDIKKDKSSDETSYYISNRAISEKKPEAAEDLAGAVRKHWGVESNNWILDVAFKEDKVITKAANQSHIMGRLRGFGLQLLRKVCVTNFQAAMERFCDSTASMEAMLRQVKFL